jgi:hypothetical protein
MHHWTDRPPGFVDLDNDGELLNKNAAAVAW